MRNLLWLLLGISLWIGITCWSVGTNQSLVATFAVSLLCGALLGWAKAESD